MWLLLESFFSGTTTFIADTRKINFVGKIAESVPKLADFA